MNNWKQEYDKTLKEIPKEIKQKILDLLWEGKSVGEICKIMNMETIYVAGIVCENISEISYLKREVN